MMSLSSETSRWTYGYTSIMIVRGSLCFLSYYNTTTNTNCQQCTPPIETLVGEAQEVQEVQVTL